jgi:FkbH-like protein
MEQLAWLPKHPDLPAALRVAQCEKDAGARLKSLLALTGYRRDFVATARLDRLFLEAAKQAGSPAATNGLLPIRLAILASHTIDHLVPAIRVSGLQRGLSPSIEVAPYGSYRQMLLRVDAGMKAFAPQYILLALDAQNSFVTLPLDADDKQVSEAVSAFVADLRHLWRQARERYGAQVVQQTYVAEPTSLFGSYDGLVPGSPTALVDRVNASIRAAAREEGVLLIDVGWHLASRIACGEIVDPIRWHQAKQLINPIFSPAYGDLVARVIAAAAGKSRKCLVLDLDNTLWGGVVGDDGLEGIKLGQGSAEGEAFTAFQRYLCLLAARGIILAVCSKNEMDVAESAFREHPEMALKRSDIAAFVANWEDKAGNIRRIAQLLNIGSDSMVFVDDNPAERDIVRRELPEVAVPEMTEDVAYYPSLLSAAGYFEAASFTADDVMRVRSYVQNAERQALLDHATDMDGYLKSLEMRLSVKTIDRIDLGRSTQLINKSNQFNLTTRRYTEADIERITGDAGALSLCLRLKDRFGDNGLISVIIARPDPAWPRDEFVIDTWLMSCRVLGRGVEAASLNVLASQALHRGARSLIGEYRPSAKNRMVEEHYSKLGFVPALPPPDASKDATYWRFDLAAGKVPSHFIHLDVRL